MQETTVRPVNIAYLDYAQKNFKVIICKNNIDEPSVFADNVKKVLYYEKDLQRIFKLGDIHTLCDKPKPIHKKKEDRCFRVFDTLKSLLENQELCQNDTYIFFGSWLYHKAGSAPTRLIIFSSNYHEPTIIKECEYALFKAYTIKNYIYIEIPIDWLAEHGLTGSVYYSKMSMDSKTAYIQSFDLKDILKMTSMQNHCIGIIFNENQEIDENSLIRYRYEPYLVYEREFTLNSIDFHIMVRNKKGNFSYKGEAKKSWNYSAEAEKNWWKDNNNNVSEIIHENETAVKYLLYSNVKECLSQLFKELKTKRTDTIQFNSKIIITDKILLDFQRECQVILNELSVNRLKNVFELLAESA